MKRYIHRPIVAILVGLLIVLSLASCKSKVPSQEQSGEKNTELTPIATDKTNLPSMQTGQWYRVQSGGRTGFVQIEQQDDAYAEGRYYELSREAWAQPHQFSCAISRRSLKVVADSVETKVTYRKLLRDLTVVPYEAPPFAAILDTRYQKPTYQVRTLPDISFAHVEGYWSALSGFEDKSYAKVVLNGFRKSLSKRDLDLMLDLYQPVGVDALKPLILFIHGGAFYVGDRHDEALVGWCRHFASLGYITASMDYRLGFLPSKDDIERAGYMAVQDAHAAMRFLITHAEEYGIDPNQIYLAGTSAGSITALNLAFMRDDNRPKASFGRKEGLFHHGERTEDLGAIASSGNDLQADFHIVAVANMWGAVNDLSILKNSHTDIVSFHGDADQLVPYDKGYPFSDVSEGLGQRLFGEMFGSQQIDQRARQLGLRSRFFSFSGEGHAFHVDKDSHQINQHWYFIRDSIATFFYQEMVPVKAVISGAEGRYAVCCPQVDSVSWQVEGGFILSSPQGHENELHVLWRTDEPAHTVQATGTYVNGLGWFDTMHEQSIEQL